MFGVSTLAHQYFYKRYQSINSWKKHPLQNQEKILQKILQNTYRTKLEKKYHITKITDYVSFKKHIPIFEYEDYKPYIIEAIKYTQNVFSRETIKWFAKSSGTTSSKSKFIPISPSFLKYGHYKAAKDVLASYHYHHRKDAKNLARGKGIIMGGSHGIESTVPQVRCGDLSAVLMQNAPYLGNLFTTPPLSISLMENWEEKIKKLAAYTIKRNITSLSGVPTWTIVLIKHILNVTGKKYLKEVWSNLQLYINGGVSFIPYQKTMTELIGEAINYIEVYNASEGFFAAQEHTNDEEGLLLYTNHGTFYEFIALENLNNQDSNAISLADVEIGKNYAMIVSNYGGLIRYLVGDTVRFTSLSPYKIQITGRTKQFINSAGEEIIVDNTDKAIAQVCKKYSVHLRDYTVAPVYTTVNQKGQHEWVIQLDTQIAPSLEGNLITDLDKELQNLNSDYQAKRYKNMGLIPPKMHITSQNIFEKWLASKQKLGGQHKVPRLSNNRKYIDEIIPLIVNK